MDAATRDFVRQRAADRCEYCHMPQQATPFIPFHVEHIIAKQHVNEGHDDPSGWLTRVTAATLSRVRICRVLTPKPERG